MSPIYSLHYQLWRIICVEVEHTVVSLGHSTTLMNPYTRPLQETRPPNTLQPHQNIIKGKTQEVAQIMMWKKNCSSCLHYFFPNVTFTPLKRMRYNLRKEMNSMKSQPEGKEGEEDLKGRLRSLLGLGSEGGKGKIRGKN